MSSCLLSFRDGEGLTSLRVRERMVERLREQGISDERVLQVMRDMPRHVFVEEALASRAYEDIALPLGYAQTISKPYAVGRMLALLLRDRALGRTLEIGTGSGYQAALLFSLTPTVWSVERIAPLLQRARAILRQLGLTKIILKHADGGFGLPEEAPFDTIISAAAGVIVPEQLIQQLAIGGRLLMPLGSGGQQSLCMVERGQDGCYTRTLLDPVRFVPLLSGKR